MGLLQRVRKGLQRIFGRLKKPSFTPDVREKVVKKYTPGEWGPGWSEQKEETLKRKDQVWRSNQQKTAWKKFNENTGYNLSRSQWDNLFDDIGGAIKDFSEYIEGGSPTIVEMYMQYQKDFVNASPEDFIEMINIVKESGPMDQEDLATNLYNALDVYQYFLDNKDPSATLGEFMDIWKTIKEENPSLEPSELKERIVFEIERDEDQD